MKCYYHPDLDSASGCSVCARPLCTSCSHTIKGTVYCQDCLVAGAELARIATTPTMASHSAARAALFAIIPGIGAVYNFQYKKAAVQFAVFASLVILANQGPDIFGLAVGSFYFYMIIDAYRSAQALLRKRVAHPETLEGRGEEINAPIWGGVLIFAGILFFLNNMGVLNFNRLQLFWPLIFVVLGLYLIYDYYNRPGKNRGGELPPPVSGSTQSTETSHGENAS